MTKLYQLDTSDNIKEWNIEVKNKNDHSEIIVRSGRLNGNLVENISIVSEGKNVGKVNETNHYTQALSEMESKIQLQLKRGYVENIDEVKSSSILGSGIPAPMLAHKYCKDGSQKNSKTLKQLGLIDKEIIVQPKLDGNRCLIKIENGNAVMYTRAGDVMKVQLQHILKDIHYDYNIILDGELFSNKFSFNKLNGLIKREKASNEDLEERKFIKYHLYDVMLEAGYEDRSKFIEQFASENIIIVPSIKIIANDDSIQEYLEKFLSEGYEGLMIRQLGIGYENKRSWNLLKNKIFEDQEYKLVGFQEDVRGGFVGSFVMEIKNCGTFNAGASGQGEEERTEMWNNQDKYLGKMATIEYFGLSEYGIPRFPKIKAIHE
jgi:DNA ligase-1